MENSEGIVSVMRRYAMFCNGAELRCLVMYW